MAAILNLTTNSLFLKAPHEIARYTYLILVQKRSCLNSAQTKLILLGFHDITFFLPLYAVNLVFLRGVNFCDFDF